MNPKSASSLAWLSFIILVVGSMVISPAGRMAAYVVAAVLAAVPTAFAASKTRIAGAVVLLIALAMMAATYSSS